MAARRYYMEFKNSLTDEKTWLIEFIDTLASPGIQALPIEVSHGSINIDQAGGTNEYAPGVYPTKLSASGYVIVMLEGFIEDISESTEKRWVVRAFRDGEIQFVGYLLPDDCDYSDESYPYSFRLSAADFQPLQAFKFGDGIGRLEYFTISQSSPNDTSAYTETPLTTGLPSGEAWTLISHLSTIYNLTEPQEEALILGSDATTSYARWREDSIDEPPGTGWIQIAPTTWVRPVTNTTTSVDTWTDPNTQSEFYQLTNYIDNPANGERIIDIFIRALEIVDLQEYANTEYLTTCMDVYNDGMGDLTGNPMEQIKLPANKVFRGSAWNEVLNDVCKVHGLRFYQSAGTFRAEQLTAILTASPKFFQYDYEGNLLGSYSGITTYNVDVSAGGIKTGGQYRWQAALREFVIKLSLDETNYLGQTYWDQNDMGSRYLGVVANTGGFLGLLANIRCRSVSKFNFAAVSGLNAAQRYNATWHVIVFKIGFRAVNRETGTVLYLEIGNVNIDDGGFEEPSNYGSAWSANPTTPFYAITRELRHGSFPNGYGQNNPFILDQFASLLIPMPGSEGDQYDLHVSWEFAAYFHPNALASALQLPENHSFFGQSYENSLWVRDSQGEKVNSKIERLYTSRNSMQNTKTNQIEAKYGDLPYHEAGIEILTGGGAWARTTGGWGRGAGPYDKELLMLMADDAMSMRTKPGRMFNGSVYASDMNFGLLLKRGPYTYVPTKMAVQPADDEWRIEMVQVAVETPPGGGVVENPIAGGPIGDHVAVSDSGVGGGSGQDPDDVALQFVTNEVITEDDVKTTVQIINTLEIEAGAGMRIKIQKLDEEGIYEWLTLAEDLNIGDTQITIISYTFLHSYAIESPLIISMVEPPPLSGALLTRYFYENVNFTGDKLLINKLDWGYVAKLTKQQLNQKMRILRNGTEMIVTSGPPIGNLPTVTKPYYVAIDPDGKKLTWESTPPCIPLENESLVVDIDLKR